MVKGNYKNIGTHEAKDAFGIGGVKGGVHLDTKFTYEFANFFHPFVGELIKKLNQVSIPGMLDPKFLRGLADTDTEHFDDFYETPQNSPAFANRAEHLKKLVEVVFTERAIDLEPGGPYANYNWELLFHFPLTIAVHLSKNQRFAEAQRWFHFIFDPTYIDTTNDPPINFWKFLAFRKDKPATRVDEVLALLSKDDGDLVGDEVQAKKDILAGYNDILKNPFRPHAVARTRHLSYQYCVCMKYLDNKFAWGDSLFRQDTIESINEAMQHYVMAANLLGVRPQRIPKAGGAGAKTFAQLNVSKDNPMSNVMVDLEGQLPLNLGMPEGTGDDASGPLFGIGRTLYFCIPHNEKMLGYWDTVEDRLFKIRNCMNIEGVVRQLALFDPPIDPGMLVKAAAAGIDIGSIVSGLNQPIGPVRSLLMIQKSQDLCGEVRSLGGALLSAIEKGDGERMAQLRQGHEIKIQGMTQEVRFLQWKQAEDATESLMRSRASALERFRYYGRLLGTAPNTEAGPDELPLDRRELTEENFDEAYAAMVGQYETEVPTSEFGKLKLAGDTSPAIQSGASGAGQLYLNTNEAAELNSHLPSARDLRLSSSVADTLASILVFIPDLNVNLQFWGLGASSKVFGGSTISEASKIAAQILRTAAAWETDQAGIASRTASYERRADDWRLQGNLAARELMQIGRQILGSLIAEQVAHREYQNTEKQIEHSKEIDELLREKFTNEELYAWMQGETSRLYYEYYRFAFDTARKAEQSMKRELMRPEVDATDYIKFNYWDAGRKGLLSGEALSLDIKRMEMAYHENNRREYELTKHVSLRQLDPFALLTLKATGTCEVTLPEWLFDLDGPGHYMRRVKTVSVSVPSVTGPYTSVNCTLTLLKSSLRKSAQLLEGAYERQGSEDGRFIDYFGAIQSVVTSSGNNDSGLFDTNLRDERVLPFEGAGANSTWRLGLPGSFRQFDYNTISDVILHVRFTAREGGARLREKATAHLTTALGQVNASGLAVLLSLKHDFPDEWHHFVTGSDFAATVTRRHFPYFAQGHNINIDELTAGTAQVDPVTPEVDLVVLSEALNGDDQAFQLALAPDGDVLVRELERAVFVVMKYSLDT